MPVVDVVDVAPVGHRHMPTPLPVGVLVTVVCGVPGGLALVDVIVVHPVQVAVVRVVDVVAVRDRHVSAPLAVRVVVVDVLLVRGR
ncbi:hypothetical protein SAMN05216266_12129 [Amycolatopsis marina]|uniref:Uncharacterized protein n=1 Tax=Amycolatopsis marina TaxID=490629 RepID=A0A1I1C5G6_9PSEU|nr:hypothetical protein SAMN05216266_12129 [Amycolatopsis marina]